MSTYVHQLIEFNMAGLACFPHLLFETDKNNLLTQSIHRTKLSNLPFFSCGLRLTLSVGGGLLSHAIAFLLIFGL